MKILVLANDDLKEELLSQGLNEDISVQWLSTVNDDLINYPDADACIDLLFENDQKRIELLKRIHPGLVLVNSVVTTLKDLPENFIRFNGWPVFLKRPITEAACLTETLKTKAEKILSCFNKKPEWVPDIPGFITARVIAMIINEAYFALEENVSTKNEIDIAMKLGTNYPYGPFEWSEKIELKNIFSLLTELSKPNKRYEPATLLKKEALL
ncbi:MAG: 3-hydroxyacyl-CoA dehydrogenase family protein [Chitinophagales bacterium]